MMSKRKSIWTDDNINLLTTLYEGGLTTRQISEALGGKVTRNAVIGKVNRLGLSISKSRAESMFPKKGGRKIERPVYRQCQYPPEDAHFVNMDTDSIDDAFCKKQRVAGKPYCEEHCEICYRRRGRKTEEENEDGG